MTLSRRDFLGAAATCALGPGLAAAAEPEAPGLPSRPFGKSGLTVSVLGFGCGSRFLMYKDEDDALAALEHAIDRGIRYIDTAHAYGDGLSETRVGKVMARRRKDVVLATKLPGRKADDAWRQLELSLKRLQTDHLDVLHIHALSDEKDLAEIEKPGGVLETLHKARDQKIARCIGITCHAAPEALRQALERHDFDATQMALNAGLARMANVPGGMKATPMREGSFESLALPVAVRKGMGIIAMKVFGQEQLVGAAPVEKLLAYALSLPVSLASLGMPKPAFIDANAAVAAAFRSMPEPERKRLNETIPDTVKVSMRDFFRDHRDA